MEIVERILDTLYNWATSTGIKLVIGLIALWIGWKIIGKIIKILNSILERKNIDLTLRSFLDAFVNISLKVLLVIITMGYVGMNTAGLVALIGSAGLAVGLALQGSLANFAGGVIILLIRPFKTGDFIDGGGHSGVIEKIGIFYTHILTGDNKEILIPNGSLVNGSIINYTSKEKRRVDLKFSVGYEEDVIKVKKVIEEVIKKQSLILDEPPYFIALSEHGDSAIVFDVRVWTKTEDYWIVYFDLLEKIKIKFDEEKISIPYPQIDVHLK